MIDKFPEIESFTHLVRALRAWANSIGVPVETLSPISYTGTVKLHGTNAGVRVNPDNTIAAQSKKQELSLTADNAGFRKFVLSIDPAAWIQLADEFITANRIPVRDQAVTIYGEWCGKGIQSGAAVTQCPKHFVIFRVAYGDRHLAVVDGIGHDLNELFIYNINQVPALTLTVDCSNFEAASTYLNEVTALVDGNCPWAKLMFGIDGVGEGYVWIPTGREHETNRWFKTKGGAHKARNNPSKDVAPVDVEKVESIRECVDIILTENRMEQMVRDNNLPLEPASIGPFMKALAHDIIKEEYLVLEENGLDWKDVGKLVQSIARTWFMEQITQSTLNS